MHLEIRSLCFVSGQVAQKHWSSCTFLWELSFFLLRIPSFWACTFVPWLFRAYFHLPPCALLWIYYFLFVNCPGFSSGNVGVKGISCFAKMLPCSVQQELPGSCLVQLLRVASCLATHPENPQSWEVIGS